MHGGTVKFAYNKQRHYLLAHSFIACRLCSVWNFFYEGPMKRIAIGELGHEWTAVAFEVCIQTRCATTPKYLLSPPPQPLLPPEHPDYLPDVFSSPNLPTHAISSDSFRVKSPMMNCLPRLSIQKTRPGTDKFQERQKAEEDMLHLPGTKGVAFRVAERGRNVRRSLSSDQILRECDDECDVVVVELHFSN